MNRRRMAIVLAFLLAAAGFAAGAWALFLRPVAVRLLEIERDVPVQVFGLGTVEARTLSKVGLKVAGLLTELHADHGDTVAKGAVLARLDTREQAARVGRAKASVDQAEANLNRAAASVTKAEATLANAKSINDRRQSLVQSNNVSVEAAETAKANLDIARADLNLARSDVEVARAAGSGTPGRKRSWTTPLSTCTPLSRPTTPSWSRARRSSEPCLPPASRCSR